MITNLILLINKVLIDTFLEDIFKCKVPNNAFWIYKGLMEARKLVKQGPRKSIENGKSTKIWEDRWLPNSPHGTPTTPRHEDCCLWKVKDLINNQCWNRVLIFRHFNYEDVERIMSIPLNLLGREDNYCLIHNPRGVYTVNSRYKLQMKKARRTNKRSR